MKAFRGLDSISVAGGFGGFGVLGVLSTRVSGKVFVSVVTRAGT